MSENHAKRLPIGEYCRLQKARLESALQLSEQARVCLDEGIAAIKQELQRLEALEREHE